VRTIVISGVLERSASALNLEAMESPSPAVVSMGQTNNEVLVSNNSNPSNNKGESGQATLDQ
jgi:hypothetical protein